MIPKEGFDDAGVVIRAVGGEGERLRPGIRIPLARQDLPQETPGATINAGFLGTQDGAFRFQCRFDAAGQARFSHAIQTFQHQKKAHLLHALPLLETSPA